jgi:CBS domain-containing protein
MRLKNLEAVHGFCACLALCGIENNAYGCMQEEDERTATRPAKRRREERAARHAVAGPIRGVLTCQATSTLSEILAIMSNHGVHQVHVVDPDSKPLCAVTAVDVLRVIVESFNVSKTDHRAFVAPLQMQLPNARLLSAMGPLHLRPDSTASGLSGGRAVSVSTSVQSDQQAVSGFGSGR